MLPLAHTRWFTFVLLLTTIWVLGSPAANAYASDDAIEEPPAQIPANGEGTIDAIDSDFLVLEMRPSSLPGVQGYGVFAKVDIPPGEVICEMRGAIVPNSVLIDSDKLYTLSTNFSKDLMKLIVTNLCAYVNDCIDLNKVNFTVVNGSVHVYETEAPTFDGFKYNAVDSTTKLGKVFIHSIMNIPAGTELCFFYGWGFWASWLLRSREGI